MKTKNPETRTRLQPDARRAEILKVARTAFADEGYAGVSMASIGEQAGVTPGLVNHYFGTKQQLYTTVIDQTAHHLSQLVRTDFGDLPADERISRNLSQFLDSIERDRDDWALLFGARAQGDPKLAKKLEQVRAETVERMARNQIGGDEPSDELRLAMRLFQGAAETAAAEWLSGRAGREQVESLLTISLVAIIGAVAERTDGAG